MGGDFEFPKEFAIGSGSSSRSTAGNPSFWKPNHIKIIETATGPTLYRAIDRVGSKLKENDYTIVSNEELGTVPEPGTLSLIGVGGLALMTRRRKKTKKVLR